MMLAEALIERADLQRLIQRVKYRMEENAKVQEGDEPTEKVEKLFSVYESLMTKLESLIIKINKTNNQTPFEEITLAEAITKRDNLRSKIWTYNSVLDTASIKQDRYSRDEIKFVRCVDIKILEKKIDYLSKIYRELDTKIQRINWLAELLD